MSGAFKYRPKFVDVRVCKPDAENVERGPKERACDHIGCGRAGAYRAPKGRERNGEYWHFCREHVADYNKRWNYFAGMSDAELAAYQRAEETGHRPTWSFRASKDDRVAAATRGFHAGRKADPLNIFNSSDASAAPAAHPERRFTRLQTLAFETMHLVPGASSAEIRARYAELVKRWHPDSNGGDRSAEAQLQKVLGAYQTLKAAGLV